MKCLLILIALSVSAVFCDDFQLLNIQLFGSGDESKTKCTEITEVKVFNHSINYECVSNMNDAKQGMLIYIKKQNGTISLTKTPVIPISIEFNSASIVAMPNISTTTNTVVSSTVTGVPVTYPKATTVPTTTELTTEKASTNETTTTHAPPTPTKPPVTSVNLTVTYMILHLTTETTQVNKNTQAVVVAVLEGLLLAAILAVFLYKMCYLKKKQQARDTFPTTTMRNTSFPASDTTGSNYYDNAAASYREGGRYGPSNVNQRGSYSYDQPLPSRIEMQNRTNAVTAPSSTEDPFSLAPTQTTNTNTSSVQPTLQSPALVPVSLTPNTDPLQQWPDQR